MRPISLILTIVAGLYLLLLAAVFLLQRQLIYPIPDRIADLPQGFEAVRLSTNDGLALSAAYRPAREGMRTVVFFHGNADSWDGGSAATARLVDEGYGILLPEYRGYGGNPGSPAEEGLYADGRAALAFLKARGIDDSAIVLIGNSLGSGVATQLAIEGKPAALVLISAYESLPNVAASKVAWLPVRLLVRDRFDNIGKMGRVEAPVLVLHGDADAVIPFSHGRALANAAPRGTFVAFPNIGHELAYIEAGQVAVNGWLAQH